MSNPVGAATEIRPFRVELPDEAVEDLLRRLAATRWPEQETVNDASQGVQLATMQEAYPNLIYFNEVDQGNHFAAWQEPELFTTEVRAAFKSLH